MSSHDTFWGSSTEMQQAVTQSSVSKWEVHNLNQTFSIHKWWEEKHFYVILFMTGKKRKKKRGCGGCLGLQLKCDGHTSLALLGPWQ